ncbi:hypothetical protein HYH02_013394 [Chlamydomonas schloesseri]|uniref:Uncharacterized protein n=1 Tax=Chlamydomonas schloesseri TaxID=2026947 RepID=A0A835VX86_9CHLO|nr:hypothetical protein HYH02_013394 [Chlamydomonas schloesseri]|eukprot:KAG2431260.1 hypothetical protein HYH02_013394 [Chlamydomonas schloesseri]
MASDAAEAQPGVDKLENGHADERCCLRDLVVLQERPERQDREQQGQGQHGASAAVAPGAAAAAATSLPAAALLWRCGGPVVEVTREPAEVGPGSAGQGTGVDNSGSGADQGGGAVWSSPFQDYPTALPSGILAALRVVAGIAPQQAGRRLYGAGPEPSHTLLAAACRDALVAAAEHGDTDMLTLLAADEHFRSAAFGSERLAERTRGVLLAALVWARAQGAVELPVLRWMFAEGCGPFAAWRGSDAPYLAAAAAMQEAMLRTHAVDTQLLDELHDELRFGFAADGRTLLTAVHLASTGRCPLRVVEWLLKKGCPAGEPGMAYGCAVGLGRVPGPKPENDLRWDHQLDIHKSRPVLDALLAADVPLGILAVEDLWRLWRNSFVGYFEWLVNVAGKKLPGGQLCAALGGGGIKPRQLRNRLYAHALSDDSSECLKPTQRRTAALLRLGLAPPALQRGVMRLRHVSPLECMKPSYGSWFSYRLRDPLHAALGATAGAVVAPGGPCCAPEAVAGQLQAAYGGRAGNKPAVCSLPAAVGLVARVQARMPDLRRAAKELDAVVEQQRRRRGQQGHGAGVATPAVAEVEEVEGAPCVAAAHAHDVGVLVALGEVQGALADARHVIAQAGKAAAAVAQAGGAVGSQQRTWLLPVAEAVAAVAQELEAELESPALRAAAFVVLAPGAAAKAAAAARAARAAASKRGRMNRRWEAESQAARAEAEAAAAHDAARRVDDAYDCADLLVACAAAREVFAGEASAAVAQEVAAVAACSPPPTPRMSFICYTGGGECGGGCSGGYD